MFFFPFHFDYSKDFNWLSTTPLICELTQYLAKILVPQARRRTTTQMELLYASSGDVSCESPTGEFPAPMLSISERLEGPADMQGHVLGQIPNLEQAVSPSALSARPVSL